LYKKYESDDNKDKFYFNLREFEDIEDNCMVGIRSIKGKCYFDKI
jgi:hypothetical protein